MTDPAPVPAKSGLRKLTGLSEVHIRCLTLGVAGFHDDGEQMNDQGSFWRERMFASLSIAASVLEFSSFLVADLLIHYSLVNTAPSPSPGVQGATVYRILAGVWLVGSPTSLVAGALSRRFDSFRKLSNVALITSVITILFCSLQMTV